ncbi:MAG: oxidoreductase [Gammaproteobacteria bacterium]|nr:oxidoreductase [Gammaproteobacteria bacterium]MBU1646099.1 oxidoreductase [Gammaproteobacteria bacterium]MBU1972161.1 oxidoreductase [Gammaproteobacteria bacterium]
MDTALFAGLKALVDSSFPKRCSCCGRVYASAEEFFRETQAVRADRKDLKPAVEEDGTRIIEAFRNCVCGSTLMEFFGDRRDASPAGEERRKRFGVLMDQLMGRGWDSAVAKAELLKLVHGQRSELIEALRGEGKPAK